MLGIVDTTPDERYTGGIVKIGTGARAINRPKKTLIGAAKHNAENKTITSMYFENRNILNPVCRVDISGN